jgi:enoyl-CoA hydratase
MAEFEQASDAAVLFEMIGEHVALVTLNRPDKRNAVNADVTQAMARILAHVEADSAVRAVVLTSCIDSVFCAGADLAAISSGNAAGIMTKEGGFAGFTDAERLTPWIAAIEGKAFGGGCEIAMACDMIVLGADASIGLPEVKRSLIAGAGGVYRLPKLVPRNIALQMIATGNPITAERAYAIGLANEVAPAGQAKAAALALAAQIAENAPLAVQQSLSVARRALTLHDTDGRNAARAANAAIMDSDDIKEGPRAFLEKRAPVWKGR